MIKIFNFLKLYLGIFFMEICCSYLILLFESFDFKGSFDVVILWSLWRVLFFGLPFLLFYLLLFKLFNKIKLYKPISHSIFNLLIYIFLTFFSRAIFGKNIPLPPNVLMFWITCISIALSPFILATIPFFKKLMVGYTKRFL